MNGKDSAPSSAAVRTTLSEIRATRATHSPSSMALLAISTALSMPPARAAEYSVSTEAELRQAVLDANADGDTTATITLTGDIALASTTAFPALSKPIAIDTNGFTLAAQSGINPGGALTFSDDSLSVTDGGTLRGGNAVDGTVNLGGGSSVALSYGSLANSAALVGGNAGA